MFTNIVTFDTAGTLYDLGKIGTYSPKCIVSNYAGNSFPLNTVDKYSDQWSSFPSSLDTNDSSCKISITNVCNNANGCGTG